MNGHDIIRGISCSVNLSIGLGTAIFVGVVFCCKLVVIRLDFRVKYATLVNFNLRFEVFGI